MKKATIGAFVALALCGALVTAQSGITLPAGSNTLKSIHLSGNPDLGIYFPTSETMYVGGASGGVTFSGTAGAITFPGGTAAAPSISFTSDSDTGIYSQFADIVQFAAGGVNYANIGNAYVAIPSDTGQFRLGGSADLILARDGAAIAQLGADAATAGAQEFKAADSTGTDTAGAALTLSGGDATAGDANGGALTLKGGDGFGTGVVGHVMLQSILFANLGTPSDGAIAYCSDCTKATPCAGSGTGSFAKRMNGTWDCD